MMNEQERAAFYQEHKDDPSIWGEAEEPDAPRTSRALSATITVRFPPHEAESIRNMAKAWQLSYSDIVREAVRLFAARAPLNTPNLSVNYACSNQLTPPPPKVTRGEGFHAGLKEKSGTASGALLIA